MSILGPYFEMVPFIKEIGTNRQHRLSFSVLANAVYQWSTSFAERKQVPIAFQSVMADVYSSSFDLFGCHIEMTSLVAPIIFLEVCALQRAIHFGKLKLAPLSFLVDKQVWQEDAEYKACW